MRLWKDQLEPAPVLPKTMRFCKVCRKDTPHEIRRGSGLVAKICMPCVRRALAR